MRYYDCSRKCGNADNPKAVAENGTAFCKAPGKLVHCTDELTGLPPADGIIFADAHPGNPVNVLRGLNPSVIDETNPPSPHVNADLDPFDPKNGFDPRGDSHYSTDFQKRYYAAQSKRMNALIDAALAKLERMKSGDYTYPDDDIIVIPRGGNPGAGPGASAALFNYDADIPEIGAFHATTSIRNSSGRQCHCRGGCPASSPGARTHRPGSRTDLEPCVACAILRQHTVFHLQPDLLRPALAKVSAL